MVWFAVDDTFPFHPKVLRAGNAALGLWVRAGAWSSQLLTDGFIDAHVALAMGSANEIEALVTNGLWFVVEGGYRFKDWDDYNPSRDEVEKRKAQNRERQQRHRDRANEVRHVEARNALRNALRNGPVTPTPPLPSPPLEESSYEASSATSRRKPETPISNEWMPTASHRTLATERGVDLTREAEAFRDHAQTHDRHCANWNMAFTTWLKKAKPSKPSGTPGRWKAVPFEYKEGD